MSYNPESVWLICLWYWITHWLLWGIVTHRTSHSRLSFRLGAAVSWAEPASPAWHNKAKQPQVAPPQSGDASPAEAAGKHCWCEAAISSHQGHPSARATACHWHPDCCQSQHISSRPKAPWGIGSAGSGCIHCSVSVSVTVSLSWPRNVYNSLLGLQLIPLPPTYQPQVWCKSAASSLLLSRGSAVKVSVDAVLTLLAYWAEEHFLLLG